MGKVQNKPVYLMTAIEKAAHYAALLQKNVALIVEHDDACACACRACYWCRQRQVYERDLSYARTVLSSVVDKVARRAS